MRNTDNKIPKVGSVFVSLCPQAFNTRNYATCETTVFHWHKTCWTIGLPPVPDFAGCPGFVPCCPASRQDQPRDAKCPGFKDAAKTQNDNNNNNNNNNNRCDSSNLLYKYLCYRRDLCYRRETALQGGLVMAKSGRL